MQKLILITLLFLPLTLLAQKPKLLTSEEHLSNSLINDIIQDSYGYIWIATEDGLNRYNGQYVTIYRADQGEHRIKNNYVQTLFQASDSTLLIGTQTGLQQYNYSTDTFQDIPLLVKGNPTEAHITSIAQDQNNNIWIATSGRGLLILKDNVATTDTPFQNLASIDFISSITIDPSNKLWLVSYKNGVYACDISTGDISNINIQDDHIIPANSFVKQSNGIIFLNINDGLYYFNENEDMFMSSGFSTNSPNPAMVMDIATVNDLTYVGTDGNGLFKFNFKTKQTERVEYFAPYIEFDKAKIHAILLDHDNNLWLGLFQKGLLMMPRTSTDITHYGLRPGGRYNIGSGCVMALEPTNNGIFIAIDSDYLYFVDNNGSSQHLTTNIPPTIMAIKQDNSTLWLASYANGLIAYNPTTNKTTDLNPILQQALPSFNLCTTALALDDKNRLWIGTYGNGLFCLNKETYTAQSFLSTTENSDYNTNEPVNNWINHIFPDGENIWIATYNGLSCFNTDVDAFIPIDEQLLTATQHSVIFAIAKTPDDQLWLATSTGLISYNFTNKTSNHFDKTNGLAANSIVSLITDSSNRIWAGTYSGISCINPTTLTIESYYSYNGLQGNEFSRNATGIDQQGRLYFGGPAGISRFNPLELKPEQNDLRIAVTKFLLNGNVIKNTIPDNDTFEFSCSEKAFSFELSTFNFSNPDKIIYEYNLAGYDTTWHQTTPGTSQISFTSMDHGNYTLNIRAKLGNNISPTTHINLIITPMWWQTNLAFLLYLLIVALIVLAINLLSHSSRKMKANLLEYQHNREIDEAKFQFFFNISHEIRTPLTLIINPIRELLTKTDATNEDKRNYSLIYRNSMRILRLINQILDMRKFEIDQIKMTYSHTNLPEFIETIHQSFQPLAKKKNIQMTLINTLANPIVDLDQDNFDKVIYNIYSNAIKFTRQGDIITKLTENNDQITITFSDSGIGIDPLLHEKIFDRFYQINNNQNAEYVGTGIGLHLTRQIVEAHGGTITASNRQDKTGTTFTVTIPRTQQGATNQPKTNNDELIDFAFNNIPEEKYRPVSNKKILIVDDEMEVNEYLTSKLARQYKITSCNNGKEAYETLLKEPFDLVISDVMMPDMNGMTLCRKIKSNININQIPVILLTAKHSDDDRNQGLMSGADAYISKPFDLEILRTTIANILANRDRLIPHVQNMPESTKHLDMKNADEILIEKVITFIDNNLADTDMNAEKIANHVGMSRTHFHRRIKEITGQNARDFVRNCRLKHAGQLLAEKHFNVSEVAYALGFSNVSHFATSFKNFYGMTPTDYMREHSNKKD